MRARDGGPLITYADAVRELELMLADKYGRPARIRRVLAWVQQYEQARLDTLNGVARMLLDAAQRVGEARK